MRAPPLAALLLVLACLSAAAQETVVIRSAAKGDGAASTQLLEDPSFESTAAGQTAGWVLHRSHTEIDEGVAQGGKHSLKIASEEYFGDTGATQTVELQRKAVKPLVLRASSRSAYLYCAPGDGYAVTLTVTYADAHAPSFVVLTFPPGPTEWRTRSTVFVPLAPVRTAIVHAGLTHAVGTAWFDEVTLSETDLDWEAVNFEGGAVLTVAQAPAAASLEPAQRMETKDERFAFTLSDQGGYVAKLEFDKTNYADPAATPTSGFSIRDWAKPDTLKVVLPLRAQPSHVQQQGALAALGIVFAGTVTPKKDRIDVQVSVENKRPEDRALTVYFTLPLDARGWTWWDGLRGGRTIGNEGEYTTTHSVGAGGTGYLSSWPAASITGAAGLAAWTSAERPACCRFGYSLETREFFVAWDVALSSKGGKPPNQAEFAFSLAAVAPTQGLREAIARVHADSPAIFAGRKAPEGATTQAFPPSAIPGWKDFGFAYDLYPWWRGQEDFNPDDKIGVSSLLGIQACQVDMHRDSAPGGADDIRATVDAMAKTEDAGMPGQRERWREIRETGQTVQGCGALKEGQEYIALYNSGASRLEFLVNPDPDLRGAGGAPSQAAAVLPFKEIQPFYVANKRGVLDGHWMENLEQGAEALDFRLAALQATDAPLIFATETLKPGVLLGSAQWEFFQYAAAELHKRKKLLLGHNGPNWCWALAAPFDAFYFDIQPGDEIDVCAPGWDAPMLYHLALAGARPVTAALSTNYNNVRGDALKRFVHWCASYGFYPSFLNHVPGPRTNEPVWRTPEWAEVLRAEAKAAIEIVRELRSAEWRPATWAAAEPAALRVERWGDHKSGNLTFSIFNPADATVSAVLHLDTAGLELPASGVKIKERSGGAPLPFTVEGKRIDVPLKLTPFDLKVLTIRRG